MTPEPQTSSPRFATITTLLLIMVIGLMPLTVLASLISGSSFIEAGIANIPFSIIAFCISMYNFLRFPLIERRKFGLVTLSNSVPSLAEELFTLIPKDLRHRTELLLCPVTSMMRQLFARGTWRYYYIAIPEFDAQGLNREKLKAQFFHEASHLASGDVWKNILADKFVSAFWGVWICFNIVGFLETLRRAGWSSLLPTLAVVPAATALLGMLIGIRYLYRLREYEADDYSCRRLLQDNLSRKLVAEHLIIDPDFGLKPYAPIQRARYQLFLEQLLRASKRFRGWLRFHPKPNERLAAILRPAILNKELYRIAGLFGFFLAIGSCWKGHISTIYALFPLLLFLGPIVASLIENTTLHEENIRTRHKLLTRLWISISISGVAALGFVWMIGPWGLIKVEGTYLEPIQYVWKSSQEIVEHLLLTISLALLIALFGMVEIFIVSSMIQAIRVFINSKPKTTSPTSIASVQGAKPLPVNASKFWYQVPSCASFLSALGLGTILVIGLDLYVTFRLTDLGLVGTSPLIILLLFTLLLGLLGSIVVVLTLYIRRNDHRWNVGWFLAVGWFGLAGTASLVQFSPVIVPSLPIVVIVGSSGIVLIASLLVITSGLVEGLFREFIVVGSTTR